MTSNLLMSCCGRMLILIATLDHATAILLRPDHGYTNQINIIRKQSQKVDLIWGLNCCLWDVLFQKRVRGFHQVSKHEKTFETTRPQAEWFYCFRVFGNLMKPEARVFVITSPTKKIRSTYHFNEFSRFKYSICGS